MFQQHEDEVNELLSGLLRNFSKLCYLLIIGLEVTAYFYDNLPIFVQVLSIAICCIIVGSYNSVTNQASPHQEVEKMTAKDAYMFPIIGSCVLCSAYFLIHYMPGYVLDGSIRLLFFTVATFSVQAFTKDLLEQFLPQIIINKILNHHLINVLIKWKEYKFDKTIITRIQIEFFLPIGISFPSQLPNTDDNNNNNNDDTGIACRVIDILTLIFGLVVSAIWFTTQHWLSNNIIGIATSIHAIAFLNPGSYYTAAVLLSLLFFYDIFWVFGTDVMVTVAKNINAPIKLIFPRPAVMEKPSMLGLGDIVLPGIYIALLLRYDIWQCIQKLNNNKKSSKGKDNSNNNNGISRFSTWFVCLACYVIALANCLVIMYYFDHAQPALLYLVPGCILPILSMAYFRGDLQTLWKYDEAEDNENTNKKTQ